VRCGACVQPIPLHDRHNEIVQTLLLALATTVLAQDTSFSAKVDVVTLFATVRDANAQPAKNLTRDDFVLLEDGVPQTIRYFSRESDLPLTIGLLVDTSRSQIRVLEPERTASYKFLDQVLREGKDEAFVASFDIRVRMLQNFTSAREELAAALNRLKIPPIASTLLYTAIRNCSENQMHDRAARKAFILLSDGVDYHSRTSLETAIEYAQRADTIIYSILFAESGERSRHVRAAIRSGYEGRGRKAMRRLALETGGAFFEATADHPIEKIYSQIEETPRNQYSIGYTPERTPVKGQYRKIVVTTKQSGLIVQTRDGYYSK
jgi:VWFA-related protein